MVMRDPTKLSYEEVFSMESLKNVYTSITEHWLTKLLLSIVVSVNDWLFSPHYEAVTIVGVFILFDTLTGLINAHKKHTVSSSGFFRFALKLVIYFILLASASLLDKVLPGTSYVSVLTIMVAFLSITETLSVLENVSELGYSVPTKVISILKLAKTQLEEPKTRAGENEDKPPKP